MKPAIKVDASRCRYYMAATMRLLLLLSAFLTAMVGIGAPAAAAPRATCEISAPAIARAERRAPQAAAVIQTTPRAASDEQSLRLTTSNAPASVVPLYAERLRV